METGIRGEEQTTRGWSPRLAPSHSTEGAVPSLVTLRSLNRIVPSEALCQGKQQQ